MRLFRIRRNLTILSFQRPRVRQNAIVFCKATDTKEVENWRVTWTLGLQPKLHEAF